MVCTHELKKNSNNTHRDWHLCSGSNFDWLEVLLLCKGIRWLGYGFPVFKKHGETLLSWRQEKDAEEPKGKNIDDKKTTFPAHRACMHEAMWSLKPIVFHVRIIIIVNIQIPCPVLFRLWLSPTVGCCVTDGFVKHWVCSMRKTCGVAKDDLHPHMTLKKTTNLSFTF